MYKVDEYQTSDFVALQQKPEINYGSDNMFNRSAQKRDNIAILQRHSDGTVKTCLYIGDFPN